MSLQHNLKKIFNSPVLVLNKHFLSIQVCNVKTAVCALVTEKARVVNEQYKTFSLEEWEAESAQIELDEGESSKYSGLLRSPSIRIFAPQVIIIPDCEFNTTNIKVIRYSRQNIYKRDNSTCQYCMKKFEQRNLTIDHVVPRSKGGPSSWNNVVACCKRCNTKKMDKSPSELGWRSPNPIKPSWRSHTGVPFNNIKKDYWENFLT